MGITDDFCFSYSAQCLSTPRPAHRGRLRRRARVGAGCGVLRVRLVTAPPGGARQNRPSAITSGTRECANARPKGTAHVQRPKVSPRRVRSQQSPRWSAERRTSRVMGRRAPALAPAGVRHSPADGCRCTRAPVGAPLPSRRVRENASLGERYASRERSRLPAPDHLPRCGAGARAWVDRSRRWSCAC